MKRLTSLIFLISTILYSQDIKIENIWQLKGATDDINISIFDNKCVDFIWKYNENNLSNPWQLYVANGNIYSNSSQYETITSIKSGDGFWIKGNDTCYIYDDVFQSGDTWNGKVYKTIVSEDTNRTWLDRNLGADNICTSDIQSDCIGDYYQWGRGNDGHEKIDSETKEIQANSITNIGNFFIVYENNMTIRRDWTNADSDGSSRFKLWSSSDGTGVCPKGFRVPTYDELSAEIYNKEISDENYIFIDNLKVPLSGYRNSQDALLKDINISTNLATTNYEVISEDMLMGVWLTIKKSYDDKDSFKEQGLVGYGHQIRCIKEK